MTAIQDGHQQTVFPPSASASRSGGDETGSTKNSTQASMLLEIATDLGDEIFRTPDGTTYALVQQDGHQEVVPLRRRAGYRSLLHGRFYKRHGRPASPQALSDVLDALEADALFGSALHEVFVRVAPHPETRRGVVVDLGDHEWRQVVVTKDGWRVTTDQVVRFVRPATLRPLPVPRPGGRLSDLRRVINVTDDGWPLIIAFLLGVLNPRGPYPLLVLRAEHGAGKSFLASVVKGLLDPSRAPLRSAPRDEGDLLVAAQHSWLLTFDNLSHISTQLSDALARLSTGGGLSKRQLYTDGDEVVLDAMRPAILTGIDDVVTRGDLLDRSIVLDLPPLDGRNRRTVAALESEVLEMRPWVLGALLDAVVHGFQQDPGSVRCELPRLADFGAWAVSCEVGAGLRPGTVAQALGSVAQDRARTALEVDHVFEAIVGLLDRAGEFSGTATELLHALNTVVTDWARMSKSWPKAPSTLSGRLRHLAPSLRSFGIEVRSTRSRGLTTWHIGRLSAAGDTDSLPPLPPLPPSPSSGIDGTSGARDLSWMRRLDSPVQNDNGAHLSRPRYDVRSQQARDTVQGSGGSDGSGKMPLQSGAVTVGDEPRHESRRASHQLARFGLLTTPALAGTAADVTGQALSAAPTPGSLLVAEERTRHEATRDTRSSPPEVTGRFGMYLARGVLEVVPPLHVTSVVDTRHGHLSTAPQVVEEAPAPEAATHARYTGTE